MNSILTTAYSREFGVLFVTVTGTSIMVIAIPVTRTLFGIITLPVEQRPEIHLIDARHSPQFTFIGGVNGEDFGPLPSLAHIGSLMPEGQCVGHTQKPSSQLAPGLQRTLWQESTWVRDEHGKRAERKAEDRNRRSSNIKIKEQNSILYLEDIYTPRFRGH
ncbi:hypothetical protein HDE_10306 [Halotydeus destructor]|nr:hypothetical protein HDE_10306 [Halotydeus destructor]